MKAKKWENHEVKYLQDTYKGSNIHEIASYLDRTYRSVQLKASRLGLTSDNRFPLGKDDIEFIKSNYKEISTQELSRRFKVDAKTIRSLYKKLGLENPRRVVSQSVKWSVDEVDYLTHNFRLKSYAILSEEMGRSVKSIEKKAMNLNLGIKGRPKQLESSCEIRCRKLLDSLDIPYRQEVRVGNFIIDFMLPSKLCIEVQGDYWHYNPRVYENEQPNSKQLQIIEKDYRKKVFLETKGYTVIYLWEYDLTHNLDYCKEIIRSAT